MPMTLGTTRTAAKLQVAENYVQKTHTLCCRIADSSCAMLSAVVFWRLVRTLSASFSQDSRLTIVDVTGTCFDLLTILFCSLLYLSVNATVTQ